MITNQNDLLGSHHDGDKALGFRGLCGLIDQHLLESRLSQPWVSGSDAGSANDICGLQELPLGLGTEGVEPLLIRLRQLTQLLF